MDPDNVALINSLLHHRLAGLSPEHPNYEHAQTWMALAQVYPTLAEKVIVLINGKGQLVWYEIDPTWMTDILTADRETKIQVLEALSFSTAARRTS